MKKIFQFVFLLTLVATAFLSCKKSEKLDYFEGGTTPVLKATSIDSLKLTVADQSSQAIGFSWTNPDYKFTTGVSSQDVSYTLQIDTTGSNFTNKTKSEVSVSKELVKNFTVKEFNSKILAMGLVEGVPHNIEVRLKSTLSNNAVPLYSNIVKVVVTPYLDVLYPVPDKLYITGDATPAGWQTGNSDPEPTPTQKFTKVSKSLFELTVQLTGGNAFLLLPQYGSWNAKYGFTGKKRENNASGDTFKPDGSDFQAPTASGMYKITVDFVTGKFTVTAVAN